MPCLSPSRTPYDVDPRRWERTRADVAASMVAAGWSRHAGKFSGVLHRRALRAFWAATP
jgi:hypothetical protein